MMWRETGRTAKFFILDARVSVTFLIFFFHWSWYTFGLAVSTATLFVILNKFGYSFPNAMRRLKVFLFFGRRRPSLPFWRKMFWR